MVRRDCVLRADGFPIGGLQSLAAPAYARAADELVEARQAGAAGAGDVARREEAGEMLRVCVRRRLRRSGARDRPRGARGRSHRGWTRPRGAGWRSASAPRSTVALQAPLDEARSRISDIGS
jgi:hypothetical protein